MFKNQYVSAIILIIIYKNIYIKIYLKKCFLIDKSQSSQCECRD